jgi:predicted CoA-binding protein
MRWLIAAAFLVAVSQSASAAEFYIVQNIKNKTCEVVASKPNPKKETAVGNKTYGSKEEAQNALKTIDACRK